MKNYFILTALLCSFYCAHAQSPLKSINYQALIVDPAAIELPGSAVQAQLYLNKDIWVKFGIYAGTTLQFEELHKTKTDAYGLINLEIGAGENTGAPGTFTSLNWGGPVMKLVTQVSFDSGFKYTEVSNRGLNYLPYAHFAEEAGKLSGTLAITSGGTGATTAVAARSNLGLGNVDNTADVDKPVSGFTLAQINTKESLSNKSISILADSASQVKYPSVKAVKDYVDNHAANASVANQASSAKLAAKATALETARTINGVPFDGTTNISIPFAAIGLTTSNLSSTAGITNGQLASSAFTLGSTTASLGGTYTNVNGLTLASPILTGTPTAPTAALSDNSQQIATTAFVKAVAANLGGVTTVSSINVSAAGNAFSSSVTDATTAPQLSVTIPLASVAGTSAGLLSNSDYSSFTNKQTALTAGTDYQRPLVSGTDYQTPITAGSGISITSGSVAVSGLTHTNLSATAGITNGQLASSAFTLGSTTASLGGTYTNVNGLTLASPVLTGTPTGPTAAPGTSSTQLATTAFVTNLVGAGSSTPDADATNKGKLKLTNDLGGTADLPTVISVGGVSSSTLAALPTSIAANTASITVNTAQIALKASINSPSFTGTPTASTAELGTNTTQLATTAFVQNTFSILPGAANYFIPSSLNVGNTLVKRTSDGGFASGPITATSFIGNVIGTSSTITGILPLTNGGTNATNTTDARANLGVGNVNNTSDVNKPVSTAQQTAFDLKSNLLSPIFTGTPSLPTGAKAVTQNANDASTAIATTAFVNNVFTTTNIAAGVPSATSSVAGKILLAGDLGGTFSSPLVVSVGGHSSTDIANAVVTVESATSINTPNTVVMRNASGNFTVNEITANTLVGNYSGTISLTNGGTGATTKAGALTALGLDQVNNTTDANKPISTLTQNALNLKANSTLIGAINGVASLGSDGKVPNAQLPAFQTTSTNVVTSTTAMYALTGLSLGAVVINTTDKTTWILSSVPGAFPSTTANWTQLTTSTSVSSVNGLTGAVALTGTSNRVTVSAGNIFDIASTYTGQNSINTVGTINTGAWNGTAVTTAFGGTGATTANAGFNSLAPPQSGNSGKFLITNGSNTSWSTISASGGWATLGNTGMTDFTLGLTQHVSEVITGKFLGTLDGSPLNFKVAGIRSGRIDNNVETGQTSFGYGAGQNAWLENSSGYRGTKNTAIGFGSSYFTNVGKENTSLGYYSLYNNQSGSGSVALGYQSMMNYSNDFSATPMLTYNTAVR